MMLRRAMTIKTSLVLILTGLVLLALPQFSRAQQDTIKSEGTADNSTTEQAENRIIDSQFKFGVYYLNEDAYRFGKYTGLTDSGVYALLDFRIENGWKTEPQQPWSFRLQGSRMGLDSRRLELDMQTRSNHHLGFVYRQIPNHQWRDGKSVYLGTGTGSLTLPSNWEVVSGSNTTAGFLKLGELLNPVKMKTERKSMTLEYIAKLGPRWNLAIDYKHEVKDGTRATWGVIGSNGGNPRAVGLAAPVDWNTDNIEAVLSYTHGRFLFSVGAFASFFKNDEKSLSWQNAFGRVGNWAEGTGFPDGFGQMSLEPDNSYLQIKTNGRLIFSRTTRLTMDFSIGSMKQDEPFFPYTINPNLEVPIALPRDSADAKIILSSFNARLNSRLSRNLSFSVNYHYDDRDNKTPRAPEGYPYIGGDSEHQKDAIDARINLPYSYNKQELNAVLNWRAGRNLSLKGGVSWDEYNRTFSEVQDSDEVSYFIGASLKGFQTASLSLQYRFSDRDIDEYIGNRPLRLSHLPGITDEGDWENHPLLRKYNQTDRERSEWRFRLDWFPNSKFNLGLTGLKYQDEYDENAFGLDEAEAVSGIVDAGWYPSKNIAVTGFYSYEKWKSAMYGRSFLGFAPQQAWDPDRDWWNESNDDVQTYHFNVGLKQLGESESVQVGVSYTYSNVQSQIDTTGAADIITSPLPELINKLSSFRLYGNVDFGENSTLRLTVEKSHLKVDDFSLDNVEPDTMANVLSFGQATSDHDVVLISASWVFQF